LPLIPLPAELTPGEGRFTLSPQTPIHACADTEATAHYMVDQIQGDLGLELTISQIDDTDGQPDTGIVLVTQPEDGELGHEGYQLSIDGDRILIAACDDAGLFYGVQTVRQLLLLASEKQESADGVPTWTVPSLEACDRPLYRQRGLMLDPARQFLSVSFIKRYIDLMAFHKMNWLHLHLTDNQAWTIEIKQYPQLTDMKLWHPDARDPKWEAGVYSQEDIRDLVAYAASRHVTIVPEIEIPAHFSVIGATLPDVMCPNNPRRNDKEQWEALQSHHWVSPCPGTETSVEILENILTEVMDLFSSPYIHLGGDEWHCKNWADCPNCQQRVQRIREAGKHAPGNDNQLLYRYLMNRLCKHVTDRGCKPMFWYDAVWEGAPFPAGSVIHMWWEHERRPHLKAAKAGLEVISSSVPVLYFDLGNPSEVQPVYAFDAMPDTMAGTDLAEKMIGMSAPLWNQKESQVDHRAFPRSSALAEIAWTPRQRLDWNDFTARFARYKKCYEIMGIQSASTSKVTPGVTAPLVRGEVVGRWAPQQMKPNEEPVVQQWDVTEHITAPGVYTIVFDYEKGMDGVYIKWALILEDGKQVAQDNHQGWTGAADEENVYSLNVAELKADAKYLLKAEMMIPDGGIDSAGEVRLTPPAND